MPIDLTLAVASLSKLGLALQRPQDRKVLTVYADLIAPRVDEAPWLAAIEDWSAGAEWGYFPSVPMLLAAYRDRLDAAEGRRTIEVEAVDAYTRVLDSAGYSPEGGGVWTYRGVLQSCGRAAAEAFLAAGAHEAFATTWKADERRRAFIAAYVTEAREEPENRLLPWKPKAEIEAGRFVAPPGRTLAASVLEQLLPKAAEEPKADPAPSPKPKRMARIVNLDQHAEKLARLRQQAEELRKEGA